MTGTKPCNGSRSWAEFLRCDRMHMLLAAMYLAMAAVNPWVASSPALRCVVGATGLLLVLRRLLGIPRYPMQLLAATSAVGISASFLLASPSRWALSIAWLAIAALQTAELRE